MNEIMFKEKMDEITTAVGTVTTAVGTITSAVTDTYDKYSPATIPVDSAATDVPERTIFRAPFDCTVSEVYVIPDDDIGQATNYMTLDVQNKGSDGTGTDSIGSLAVNSTNTIDEFVGVDLVTTNASVSEGECLTLKKTITGDGQIFPGGLVVVKYTKA